MKQKLHPSRLLTLEEDGFLGEFYPGRRRIDRAVLYVGGASCNRRMTLAMGRYLVDAGFTVLFLGFYLWKGLPRNMWRIPVDYAERASKWLAGQGYEVCMMGASTGAGYTLLSASLIPEIHGVVAMAPFDHVFEGMEMLGRAPHCSVYQYHGAEYPYSCFDIVREGWPAAFRTARKAGVSLKGFMRYGYESATLNPDSRIRVENINGDILLTTAEYDIMWPADQAVARMERVLQNSAWPHRLTTIAYPCRSHGLGVGDIGPKWISDLTMRTMGMSKELTEKAREDIIHWLDHWGEIKPTGWQYA